MESLVTGHTLQNFFSGKKVFVTGHSGFKGSWLITWLQLMGDTIKGYALPLDNENDIFRFVILHLAAQPLVRLSYKMPAETFEVNVSGTANLLDALLELQKNCTVVIVTTDKVYENKERNKPYKENNRLGGYDPYSASKACAEIV